MAKLYLSKLLNQMSWKCCR